MNRAFQVGQFLNSVYGWGCKKIPSNHKENRGYGQKQIKTPQAFQTAKHFNRFRKCGITWAPFAANQFSTLQALHDVCLNFNAEQNSLSDVRIITSSQFNCYLSFLWGFFFPFKALGCLQERKKSEYWPIIKTNIKGYSDIKWWNLNLCSSEVRNRKLSILNHLYMSHTKCTLLFSDTVF